MPEMNVLPSLSSPPATIGAGNPAGPTAVKSAGGSDATAGPGTEGEPFAAVLRRQLGDSSGQKASTTAANNASGVKADDVKAALLTASQVLAPDTAVKPDTPAELLQQLALIPAKKIAAPATGLAALPADTPTAPAANLTADPKTVPAADPKTILAADPKAIPAVDPKTVLAALPATAPAAPVANLAADPKTVLAALPANAPAAPVANPAADPKADLAALPAKKVGSKVSELADPGAMAMAALMSPVQAPVINAPRGPSTANTATGKKPGAPADAGLLAGTWSAPLPATMAGAARSEDKAAVELPAPAGDKAAITAALATADGSLPAVHAKQADAAPPESAFRNLLAAAQATPHAGSPAAPLAIDAPFASSGWAGNVGDKLVWMVGHQEQRAELVLNPPHLGRVEVSLSLHGDQANAQFVTHNPAVRDALEAAMPRLREMLAGAGVNLGQTQVGSGSAGNAGSQSPNNRGNGDNSSLSQAALGQGDGALRQINASSPWLKQGKGMVDVFA
ncbi:MAG TPA: flagellar hook-length control protein FliK [Rhodocyclaceae bacterium]|nr:flagellar hook-length control protein FliK [Rhodocyclaceae bacterium]